MIAPNYPPEKQKSAMPKRPNVIWVLAGPAARPGAELQRRNQHLHPQY